MLAKTASKESEVAAPIIAGEPAAMDSQTVAAAIFIDPESGRSA